MYEENELLFGDGGEPFDDDDNDFDNADGNPYSVAIYGADGQQLNPGIVKAMPPVNADLRKMQQNRQQPTAQRVRKPEPGKYIKITVENTKTAERSFYLFASTDEKGVINTTGTAFAAIDDSGADNSLKVTYFDENVAQFLQQHRTGKVSYVPFMRAVCSDNAVSLSSFTIVVDELRPGQNDYSKLLAIHGMGYSSERNQLTNELTYNLEKKNQGFYIGGNYRTKITVPPSSSLSLMIHMGEQLDVTRAYTEGRIR